MTRQITFRPAKSNEKATHGTYTGLIEKFEGLERTAAAEYTKEMENLEEFKEFVARPGYQTVLVDYQGFWEFVKWRQNPRNKKRAKEALKKNREKIA